MNENPTNSNNLLDTTDCLEAVGVFRGWKNFLLVITMLCLIFLQVSFWLVDIGYVEAESETITTQTTYPMIEPPPETWPPPAKDLVKPLQNDDAKQSVGKTTEIEKAAEEVVINPNQPAEKFQQQAGFPNGVPFSHLSWAIRLANGLLILSAILYCLCLLFSLKISLIGRLGGINHISRAFFLSLILVVLLLPWQVVFDGIISGVIYTPCEMARRCSAQPEGIFAIAIHYLRFTGYWLLAVLFLIFSQVRSARWTKSVLRRLEVI